MIMKYMQLPHLLKSSRNASCPAIRMEQPDSATDTGTWYAKASHCMEECALTASYFYEMLLRWACIHLLLALRKTWCRTLFNLFLSGPQQYGRDRRTYSSWDYIDATEK